MKTITQPISSLIPLKLSYSFNSTEELESSLNTTNGGLSYYNYVLLKNFKDAVFSNDSSLVLTELKNIETVFKTPNRTLVVGSIPTSFKLKVANNLMLMGDVYFKTYNKKISVGGSGKEVVFNVVPVSDDKGVHLRFKHYRVVVEKNYPYTLYLSEEPVSLDEKQREIFFIDYVDKKITLKAKTKDGFRYVSYGEDRIVRCIGLEINDIKINDYHLIPEFNTAPVLTHGFIPLNEEVKYFTELDSPRLNKALDIKLTKQLDTNLLIDCPLYAITNPKLSSIPINMAVIKTNFTPEGTFSNTI